MPAPSTPDYAALDLPAPPDDRPYVLINMVMSADGRAAIESTERGLGSRFDQRLMRELRANADVVLAGAGTLRAGGTSSRVGDAALERLREERGATANPLAAVLSRSGDLPLERAFFTARDFDALVYLASDAPSGRREAIEATGRRVVVVDAAGAVPEMLLHMRRDLDARVLLVEGGPSVNGELFERGLVDEYFLTLGPVVVGGGRTLTPVIGSRPPALESATRLELLSAVTNEETGEIYLRYRTAGRGGVER